MQGTFPSYWNAGEGERVVLGGHWIQSYRSRLNKAGTTDRMASGNDKNDRQVPFVRSAESFLAVSGRAEKFQLSWPMEWDSRKSSEQFALVLSTYWSFPIEFE
jgi:hypothetical protein